MNDQGTEERDSEELAEQAGQQSELQDDERSEERDDRNSEQGAGEVGEVEGSEEDEEDGDSDRGLTDEDRSRGGKNSSENLERDDQGRFVRKD